MSLHQLLNACRQRGITLQANLDTRKVRYDGPPGSITPDLIDAMRQHKSDLMLLCCLIELGCEVSTELNERKPQ